MPRGRRKDLSLAVFVLLVFLSLFLQLVQSQDALVLKGSPGMDAALRLIAFCQKMAESRAQVSVDATVQVSGGFHIHVDLCVPTGGSNE